MTKFPWKLFKGSQEIVFPKGARRYVQFDVQQIQSGGAVELDWNANAVWTGDDAFRLHAITISCTDQTPAPISDLWQGDIVRLEAPFEFAVPGPSAVLKYDPVPGSVYGVNADDTPVGSTLSDSRTVAIVGAVAIRYRPIIDCRVVSRSGPGGSQGRADASWSIDLIEQAGDVSDESDSETLTFSAPGLRSYALGDTINLNLATFVTTNTGLPVFFAIASGTLPPGMAMIGSGLISGMPSAPGLHVITVMAASGPVSAVQTIPFYGAVPSVELAPDDLVQVVDGAAVSLALGPLTTVTNTSAAPTYAVVSGDLPAGVTLNASTGLVSGTATGGGVFAFVVRASAGGAFDEQSYTVQVIPVDLNREAQISSGTSAFPSPQTDVFGNTFNYALFRPAGTLTVTRSGWVTGYQRGGGAPGGNCTVAGRPGGGGGAGEYLEVRIWLEAGTYTVGVAASAPAGSNFGNDTTLTRNSDGVVVARAFGGSRGGNSSQVGVNNTNAGGSAGGGGGGLFPGGTASGAAAGRGTNGASGGGAGVGGGGGGALSAASGKEGGTSVGRRLGAFVAAGNGGGGGGVAVTPAGTGGDGGAGNGGLANANGAAGAANTGSGGGGAGTTVGNLGGAGASGEAMYWVRS